MILIQFKGETMSYTSGTNYRSIKNFSGGRGVVSHMKSVSLSRTGSAAKSAAAESTGKTGSSNLVLTTQLKTYSKIAQDSAQDIQESGGKLTATGDTSLFAKVEKAGSTKSVVSEATDFVNSYNNMLSSITKLGGSENKKFIAKLKEYAEENAEALKKVGIMVLTDGSLTMNKNEMNEASLDNLKKVFNGENSFADKVTKLSSDIEENVTNKLKENLKILGASTSTVGSAKASGSYFNLSI